MTTEAFMPASNSFARDITTVSQLVSPAIPFPQFTATPVQYLFTVMGSVPVYIASGPIGTVPVAAIPVSGGNATGIPLLAGSQTVMSFSPGTVIAAIATATGSSLTVTVGAGV